MPRLAFLRAGYAALGLAFGALAASAVAGGLLLVGLLVALVGGILLAFSRDDLPKYAGLVLVAYFVLSIVAFLAASPVTIKGSGGSYFVNGAPPDLADDVMYYVGLASPLMLGATAVLAAWEREWAPRLLLWGAVGGFVLVALLSILLRPGGTDASAIAAAEAQAGLVSNLFMVSALAGAAGALWAAGRPDSYA